MRLYIHSLTHSHTLAVAVVKNTKRKVDDDSVSTTYASVSAVCARHRRMTEYMNVLLPATTRRLGVRGVFMARGSRAVQRRRLDEPEKVWEVPEGVPKKRLKMIRDAVRQANELEDERRVAIAQLEKEDE